MIAKSKLNIQFLLLAIFDYNMHPQNNMIFMS
jgi:hypothetical protein